MEKYVFDKIIFKKSKYRVYWEDHDEVTFNYSEVTYDTVSAFIDTFINYLETELGNFEYDLYKTTNGVVTNFDDYIITGKVLASYIRKSNIQITYQNIIDLGNIKRSLKVIEDNFYV